jgi:hypothetical protein
MRRRTGLHTNEARPQLLKECQNVAALELTANDHIAVRIDAMNLENRLCDVETDRCDRLHACLLRIRSPHRYVPVEEPSTASEADIAPRVQRLRH